MNERRDELLKLIREKSVRFGDFTLSSGKKSSTYIDARLTTLDPQGAYLIGNLILDRLEDGGIRADAVGGLSLGADPISTAVSLMSFVRKEPLRALLVRKETKAHGMAKKVEGELRKGDRVVVIEDVISTGGSALTAIEAIEAEGAHVAMVVGLVDRLMGGRETLEAKGYKVDVVFTIKEILGERWQSFED